MNQFKIVNFEQVSNVTNCLFSSKSWLSVLKKSYNLEIYYFIISNNSHRQRYLPFTVIHNLKGSTVISLPFSDLIRTDEITKPDYYLFFNYLKTRYPNLPIILKTTSSDYFQRSNIIRSAVFHTINLKNEIHLNSSFLRGVNKARNGGLKVVHTNSLHGLEIFYKLYTDLRRRKFNSIPQPFSFFKNIFDEFIKIGKGEIISVFKNEEVIAALIALKTKDTLYYKFGASDLNELSSRPNNLLFYYLIRFAKENGYSLIDLGLSGISENYAGLRRFKENLGGVPKEIIYYRFNPPGFNSSYENKVNRLLHKYTTTLIAEKYDVDKINKVSELIYKNFA